MLCSCYCKFHIKLEIIFRGTNSGPALKLSVKLIPWIPNENTLESKICRKSKDIFYRVYMKGTQIPAQFWETWAIVDFIIQNMEGITKDTRYEIGEKILKKAF